MAESKRVNVNSSNGNGTGTVIDIWKSIAMTLGGILVSVSLIWFGSLKDTVSRSTVEKMIEDSETKGPYILDKQIIQQNIAETKSDVKDLKNSTTETSKQLDNINFTLKEINARLDRIDGVSKDKR